MVLKKLILSMCSSIFGLKSGRWRIKGPPQLFELIKSVDTTATSDKAKKEGPPALDHDRQQAFFDEVEVEVERCCVCLSRLEEGEEDTRRLLPCLHEFHRECIDRWWLIGGRRTCPLCRFLMEDEEEKRGDVLTEEMIMWFSSFHVAGF